MAVAPTIKAPATASVAENGSVAFSSSITITDAKRGSSTEKLTNSRPRARHPAFGIDERYHYRLEREDRSASMTISGTLTNLNKARSNGLTYTPTRNFTGSASISLELHRRG